MTSFGVSSGVSDVGCGQDGQDVFDSHSGVDYGGNDKKMVVLMIFMVMMVVMVLMIRFCR